MAVANTKSNQITNADATPLVLSNEFVSKASLLEAVATVEVAAADDDNSVYRMIRVPSGARISEVSYQNDAITGGTAFDIAVYKTAKDGGAVVSAQLFASAVNLSSASTAWVDGTYEATATNIDKVEKRLWELLGLSVDPMIDYDICFVGTTVGSGAGTLAMRVRFAV